MSQNKTKIFWLAMFFGITGLSFQNCGPQFTTKSMGTNASRFLVGGRNFHLSSTTFASGKSSRCALEKLSRTGQDSSVVLQACIDRAGVGDILMIPPGRFTLINQVRINRSLLLITEGLDGTEPCAGDEQHKCAEFLAGPETATISGMISVNGDSIALDHIVINGNKEARQNSPAAQNCKNNKNEYGYNAVFAGSNITLTDSVFKNALCATGVYLSGSHFQVQNNKILKNGVHNISGMWSDGMTAGELKNSVISFNLYEDNTDVDLIFGACSDCQIQSNTVSHSDSFESSSFAGIMIQAWPNGGSSGNYTGADISQNAVNCSTGQRCGIGIYLGNSAWYEAKVYGGKVHNNSVYGAQQGYAIDQVSGFTFSNNSVAASGGNFLTSCGTKQLTSLVLTPGTSIDLSRNAESASQFAMTGCIPNWWTQAPQHSISSQPTPAPAPTISQHGAAQQPPATPSIESVQTTQFITTLYRGVLKREPEAAGLQNWLNIGAQSRDCGIIVRGITSSPESASRRSTISLEQTVTDLYLGILDRSPESTAVVNSWVKNINELGYAAVVNHFINSDEFRHRCESVFSN